MGNLTRLVDRDRKVVLIDITQVSSIEVVASTWRIAYTWEPQKNCVLDYLWGSKETQKLQDMGPEIHITINGKCFNLRMSEEDFAKQLREGEK